MKWFLFALVMGGHLGCGYHPQEFEANLTLSVPYIKGDLDGLFTEIFIKRAAESGLYRYVSSGGRYSIEMAILQNEQRQIGYQYDREEVTGKRINRLEPTEGRQVVTVEVQVVDTRSGEISIGPFTMTADADYDFVDQDSAIDVSFIDPTGTRRSVLDFSLGQLDSREGAREMARRPLYDALSLKILSALRCQR